MNYIAAITSQGQLTIPKSLRDKYGISKQAKAVIKDMGTGMLIKTYTEKDFWALKGILKNNPVAKSNRSKKPADIIREENKAFIKAISENAVSET
jgi:bifunctional DNA-binding transcriptional regulator/antitoxin component of YhaV-PrlF toxin-antitoxin module